MVLFQHRALPRNEGEELVDVLKNVSNPAPIIMISSLSLPPFLAQIRGQFMMNVVDAALASLPAGCSSHNYGTTALGGRRTKAVMVFGDWQTFADSVDANLHAFATVTNVVFYRAVHGLLYSHDRFMYHLSSLVDIDCRHLVTSVSPWGDAVSASRTRRHGQDGSGETDSQQRLERHKPL